MPVVHSSASVFSTDGVLSGQGPSSNVSTTSLSRRKSSCLKCSKPKPGPPVVSISTVRPTPSAPGVLHAALAGCAEAGAAAAAGAGGGGGRAGGGAARGRGSRRGRKSRTLGRRRLRPHRTRGQQRNRARKDQPCRDTHLVFPKIRIPLPVPALCRRPGRFL